jgi:hypothetical protein
MSLVHCQGATYGIPLNNDLTIPLQGWASADDAEHLHIVVPAGTSIEGCFVRGNVLVECEVLGTRVLIPRDALEELH